MHYDVLCIFISSNKYRFVLFNNKLKYFYGLLYFYLNTLNIFEVNILVTNSTYNSTESQK